MPDDLDSAAFLAGLRELGPQLVREVGSRWKEFAPEFLTLLRSLLDAAAGSEDQRRRLVDNLIALLVRNGAADATRVLLSRGSKPELIEREMGGQALAPPVLPPARSTAIPSTPLMARQLGRVSQELIRELEARYLNVRLADEYGQRILPSSEMLKKRASYLVRVDIGSLSPESVVEHSSRTAFPPLNLADSEEGRWLDVVGSSRDFTVPSESFRFFLPRQGSSWVCDCDPTGRHRCLPEDRRAFLDIAVTTPGRACRAALRLALYDGCRLLQSLLLTARVEIYTPGPGYGAKIDYNLTARFTDVEHPTTAPIASVLTNDNTDATHTIIIKDRGSKPLHIVLTESQLGDTIAAARAQLRATHFLEYGGKEGVKLQRQNLLNSQNGKALNEFVDDLKRLAPLGWKLLDGLLAGQMHWWGTTGQALFREPGILLVGRKKRSQFVFPWAMVYDIPLDTGKPESYLPCPVLQKWPIAAPLGGPFPTRCPEEARHVPEQTICPFGFWGIRHQIEQPPSQPDDRSAPCTVATDRRPLEVVVARALTLDSDLTEAHLKKLQTTLKGFTIHDVTSGSGVKTLLGQPALELVYFYCHGRTTPLAPGVAPQPELEVGKADHITPDGIFAWSLSAPWTSPDHWRDTAPLVFINGCHTAEITPATLVSFVDTFADLEAAGVIGTEITIDQRLANEAGEEILARFASGATVADSIRELRGRLLSKGNCVGLAYTPYCTAQLRLVQPV